MASRERAAAPADGAFMRRALDLAENGWGRTAPNPMVGAVVVRDGVIVGEGWHRRYGEAHAEVEALRSAGERARGATLYVTLEPCNHQGRTPPCSQAVIDAGIGRVVVGSLDPNPKAAGGVDRLRSAGVEGEGVDSFESRGQNEAWRTWVRDRRPFVVYKVAVSLDGRTTVPGSRWVTGEASRRLVHELRAEVDAVAVGAGTARADLPQLTARDVETPKGQPRRLVFGRGPLPDVLDLELRSGPLDDELRTLADEGVQSLLLEGGPTLAASFVAAGLVDKLLVFVAPRLAGAGPGLIASLPEPLELRRLAATPVGEDILLSAYVHEP